jgi:hypothetical protein
LVASLEVALALQTLCDSASAPTRPPRAPDRNSGPLLLSAAVDHVCAAPRRVLPFRLCCSSSHEEPSDEEILGVMRKAGRGGRLPHHAYAFRAEYR